MEFLGFLWSVAPSHRIFMGFSEKVMGINVGGWIEHISEINTAGMGVRGFTKYLASCEVPCYTVEQLMPGSLLLIDGNAWMFKLFQSITNTSDTYKGDGYRELDDMIQHEVQYWTLERRMELVVYFDGPTSQFKAATATKRGEQREEQWGNIYNFITDGVVYDHDEYPLPPLWSQQLRATLHDCQVEVIDTSGEADAVMAAAANQAIAAGRVAYCISEDSDFYFFRDTPSVRFTTLSRRTETVDVYRRATIARILGLSETQLVELALLIGNDYTSHFSRSQFADVSIRSRDIDELTFWFVSQGPNYQLSSADSDLQTVLCFSRDLYELRDVSKYAVDEDGDNDLLRLSDLDVSELLDWEVNETDAIGIGDAALAYMEYIFLNSTDSSPTPLSHHVTEQYLQALSHMLDVLSEGNIDIEPSHKVPSWRDLLFTHHYQLVCSQLICNHELYVHPQHLFNANIFYDELSKVYDDVELNLASMALNNISETAVKSTEVKEKQSAKDKKSASFPKTLPIDEHRSTILNKIGSDRVTIIHGETGCGKSSRVPVMILEESNRRNEKCKMMVSQPRRIAASALMKRLRPTLGDQIGLHMGHGVRESSRSTRIYFVTTGYLVRLLAHKPSYFNDHTHVIIDEVHERSVDGDLVCHFVKKLLDYNSNIRVVLMSATMNIELYQNYFAGFGDMRCLSVGVRCHPLEINHLESIRKSLPPRPDIMKCITSIEAACSRWKPGREDVGVNFTKDQYKLAFELVANVVETGTGVLIFVAGMADIVDLSERFSGYSKYRVFAIHSDIPFEEQENAFDPVQPHEIKVVIATNAAESSITLPDVDVVICLGMHKAVAYNANKRETILHQQFICKASATQRAGRTGRVRPGKVYRLYTEELYNRLPTQGEAEILRSPLEETILTLRVMLENSPEFTGVVPILEELIEKPQMQTIDKSFEYLHSATLISDPNDNGFLTPTGRLVGALPLNISLGRLVAYGVRLGVMHEAVILAAALSQPRTPFRIASPIVHKNPDEYNAIVRQTFLCANKYDRGMYSEPLMMWQLLEAYREVPAYKQGFWCVQNGIVLARMKHFHSAARNLLEKVSELCPKKYRVKYHKYRENELVNVLRLILVWSCDDNFFVFKSKSVPSAIPRICFTDVLDAKQLNSMFPKDLVPWDDPSNMYLDVTVPIPSEAFVDRFGLAEGIHRVVKHLNNPCILWVQCKNIDVDVYQGRPLLYIDDAVATLVLPHLIAYNPLYQNGLYIFDVTPSQGKRLKKFRKAVDDINLPYICIYLSGVDSVKVTTTHMQLNLDNLQKAFGCPYPCILINENKAKATIIQFTGSDDSGGLFDDIHVGLRLFNAYKSGYRDLLARANKSDATKEAEKKNSPAVGSAEWAKKRQSGNGEVKEEDTTFSLTADCSLATWKHIESDRKILLPRHSVVGSCYYLGSDVLIGVAQSVLLLTGGSRACNGVTLCPPGITWIRRALACVDRQFKLPAVFLSNEDVDIADNIACRLREIYGDDVAYDEDLVYLVEKLYEDMELPQLRSLTVDTAKNAQDEAASEEACHAQRAMDLLVQATTERKETNPPKSAPDTTSRRQRKQSVLKEAKEAATNAHAGTAQSIVGMVSAAGAKQTSLTSKNAKQPTNEYHSIGLCMVVENVQSNPTPNRLPFPCPMSPCTAQCLTMDNLKKHMKNVHNVLDDDIISYKSTLVNGQYILSPNNVHPCNFAKCKLKFPCISDAEEHFAAVHAKKRIMNGYVDTAGVSLKLVAPNRFRYPCEHPNCTAVFETLNLRKNHSKKCSAK